MADLHVPISAWLPIRWRILFLVGGLAVGSLAIGIGILLGLATLFRWLCGTGG